MSFEIKQKTKIKISIYGKEFEMHKPTVEQAEALQKRELEDNEDKTEVHIFTRICESLAILGLPLEFSKKMEADHLIQLMNYISGELDLDKKKPEAGL